MKSKKQVVIAGDLDAHKEAIKEGKKIYESLGYEVLVKERISPQDFKDAAYVCLVKENDFRLTCRHCGKRVSEKTAVEVEVRSEKSGTKTFITCEKCGKELRSFFETGAAGIAGSEEIDEETWRRYQRLTKEKEENK